MGIKDVSFRDICFRGAGNVVGPQSKHQANVMREWCATMPTLEAQNLCFHEALNHLLQSDGGKAQLKNLCAAKEISYEDICKVDLLAT